MVYGACMSEFGSVATGNRLKALREAKKIGSQATFAKLIGASTNAYNNWETGFRLLPVSYAIKICAQTGATLDYIFRGDIGSLPTNLAMLLSSPEKDERRA